LKRDGSSNSYPAPISNHAQPRTNRYLSSILLGKTFNSSAVGSTVLLNFTTRNIIPEDIVRGYRTSSGIILAKKKVICCFPSEIL
jgi:hypothetical protein